MLKVEANMKEPDVTLNLEIDGDIKTIAIETAAIIRHIFEGIQESSLEAAEVYKGLITHYVTHSDSPTWKGESNDAES